MKFWRLPLLIWRYIGFEILAIFFIALFAQIVINIGVFAFQLVQRDGLRLAFIWPILFKFSILSLYYTIPISLLFSVTLGFGRMIGDLEVTALKACGLSYFQLAAPFLFMGLVFSGISSYLNSTIIPEIHYDKRNLRLAVLQQLTKLGSGGESKFPLPRDGGYIYCRRYFGNNMEKVRIDLWTRDYAKEEVEASDVIPTTIHADRAKFFREQSPEGEPQLVVDLFGIDIHIPDSEVRSNGNPHFLQKISTGHYRKVFSLTESDRREKDLSTHVLKEHLEKSRRALEQTQKKFEKEKVVESRTSLANDIRSLKDDVWDSAAEIARRRAFSFSCFTFLWAAIPLTFWLNHKNRLVPFFCGNILAVGIFYPLVTIGITLSKKGTPAIVTHSGNIVLLLIGGVLLWRLQKR